MREGIRTVLTILANEAFIYLGDSFLEDKWEEIFNKRGEFYALQYALMQWCQASETPIVLFIDEVDSLVGDTLISLLRNERRTGPGERYLPGYHLPG
ncbi:MAG: AAA family ATPase [Candidatus Aminicenantes bacterium]